MFLSKISLKLAAIVAALDTTKMIIMPNYSLLLYVCILMIADFITGILKAKFKKEPITSERMRGSIIKFLQYFGCIGLLIILQNQKKDNEHFQWLMRFSQDGMTILIMYIETLSVLENLYQMDMKNPFARNVIKPLYFLLSLAVKNNPFARAADDQRKIQDNKPDEFDEIDRRSD